MPSKPSKQKQKKRSKKLLRSKSPKRSYHKISVETVRHVAKLARLDLTEAEIKKFQKDLNDILSAFCELDKAKPDRMTTKGRQSVEPSFQPFPIRDVTREDNVEENLTQEKALENTKHKQDGYFKGPRVV